MLARRGLAPFVVARSVAAVLAVVSFAGACHRNDVTPAAPVAPPAARAAPKPEPFTHPLLAQAERPISNEDCSRGALWAMTQQLRLMHKQAKAVIASSSGAPGPGASCLPPPAESLMTMIKGPLLERVGGCVGRDGPYDPEWDMVNSGVLSLGVCLDCSRSRDQRTQDCKHGMDKIDRAEKAAQSGSVEQRLVEARGGH